LRGPVENRAPPHYQSGNLVVTSPTSPSDGLADDPVARWLNWVRPRLSAFFQPPAAPADPASMSDVQLHHAIFVVSNRLLYFVGQWVMKCYDGRPVNDERFKWAMPTTVHAHVQLGFTSASDSAWLAAKGLELSASAAALGPIRDVAETLARLSWLLQPADDQARLGRAYGFMQHDIDQEFQLVGAVKKSSNRLGKTPDQVWDRYSSNSGRKRDRLAEIAAEDGVAIEKLPQTSDLFELYLHDMGGYPLFSALSKAASHPGCSRPFVFYADPTKGMALDFDFQKMHAKRAFWLSKSQQLYIALSQLVGPELDWPADWEDVLNGLAKQLKPLADEADRRVMTPLTATFESFTDTAPNPGASDR